MSSLFTSNIWSGKRCYVTAESDFLHHNVDPAQIDIGTSCIITFSSDLFRNMLASVPSVIDSFEWPYSTTPLKLCATAGGKPFAVHFPSYGGARVANSLEQLAACGVRDVFGLGLGGTPRADMAIGDILLLEGSLRGDGVSRYYAPIEFPAIADVDLTGRVQRCLDQHAEVYHRGLSFGTDALYREEADLVALLRELRVLSIDLESSAFFTVGRRLGLACCWVGVISDRLVTPEHEGNIHSEHVMETLLRLGNYMVQIIESS